MEKLDIQVSSMFYEWIKKLSVHLNHLYYRDQTPESLIRLAELALHYRPTKIVELGTLFGLSLRLWLAIDISAELTAVDLSFEALRKSQHIIPVDLSNVRLLEQNILETNFGQLWKPEDIVLLYIDAHNMHDVPIMEYLLNNAIPLLPSGSLVVVDDMWYSSLTLNNNTAKEFFEDIVINEIDPLQCFNGYYAAYWQGGSFLGFPEIIPFMQWVNKNKINLMLKRGVKSVAFECTSKDYISLELGSKVFNKTTGNINYNPINYIILGNKDLQSKQQTFELCINAAKLYEVGNMQESLRFLNKAMGLNSCLRGIFYAQAVIFARMGKFDKAITFLHRELQNNHTLDNAKFLLKDILSFKQEHQCSKEVLTRREYLLPESITIFAVPKSFDGQINIIQRNAIKSWTLLSPRPEIILFGNEKGIAECAREFGVIHVPDVKCNEYGTPLVNALFKQAQQISTNSILAYINADVILIDDFLSAINNLKDKFQEFLMIGQRWDLDVYHLLDYERPDWQECLLNMVANSGVLHPESGLDYFVFTNGLYKDIPPFAIGRTAWDNWLVYRPLYSNLPVVDATKAVTAVHQNHHYAHVKGGKHGAFNGLEAQKNRELAEKLMLMCYTSHATWEVNSSGLITKRPLQSKVLALCNEGLDLLRNGEPEKALFKFNMALKMGLPVPGLNYARACALYELSRFDDAIFAAKEELASNPNYQGPKKLIEKLSHDILATEEKNTISVVIPCYNRARYIKDAIKSALNQSSPPYEILVVDDGSTDTTCEVVKSFKSSNVRYVYKEHSGAAATRNLGVAESKGDFVLWLDSDDILMPDVINIYNNMLQKFPDVDVLYGNLLVTDEQLNPQKNIRYEDWYNRNADLLARMVNESPMPNSGTLIRKVCFERIGGYNESFLRAHDYELWSRLAKEAKFKHVNALVCKWRWHENNMSAGTVKIDTSYDARVIHSMLERYTLKELFPDIDWQNMTVEKSEAIAFLKVALRLFNLNDFYGAFNYVKKSYNRFPSDQAKALLEKFDAHANIHNEFSNMRVIHCAPKSSAASKSKRRRKILIVVHNLPPDGYAGVEIYTRNFSNQLVANGCDVSIFYPKLDNTSNSSVLKESVLEGIKIYNVFARNLYDLNLQIENKGIEEIFCKLLDDNNFDLIHFQHTIGLPFSLLEIAKNKGLPVCLTLHDFWFICPKIHMYLPQADELCDGPTSVDKCVKCLLNVPLASLNNRHVASTYYYISYRHGYLRDLFHKIDLIVSPSRYLEKKYTFYGLGNGNILCSPLGIEPVGCVNEKNMCSGSIVFGFLGTIQPLKRPSFLAKAFKKVNGRARLIYWGNGDADNVESLKETIKSDDRIEYRGAYNPENLPEILSEIDIVVIPSAIENYPLVIRECLSAGIPVIASDVGGIPEIISHMKNGILFDPNSIDELSRWLQIVVDNPFIIEQLRKGITGLKTIADDVKEWIERYDTLCEKKASVPSTFTFSEKQVPKIGFLSSEPPSLACPFIRLHSPLSYLSTKGDIQHISLYHYDKNNRKVEIDFDALADVDVVIVQRQMAVFLPFNDLKRTIRAEGKDVKVVYDIDDLLTNVSKNNMAFQFYDKNKHYIVEYIRNADLVTVSTPNLKSIYAPLNDNIALLENCIDMRLWSGREARDKRKDSTVRILFSGITAHGGDLKVIEDAIVRIIDEFGDRVSLLLWGITSDKLSRYPQVERLEFVREYREYAELLKGLIIDFAVVPLEDNSFNRAKSHIKWLEYSICKIPGIYTNLDPYSRYVENGKTGMLVENTPEAWYDAMRKLVVDEDLRLSIGTCAYEEVKRHHTLDENAHRWIDVFNNLLSDPGRREAPSYKVKASIIIPVFNELNYTKQCLEAIVENTPGDTYEVVIVDNASTDGTKEFLECLEGDVKIITNRENLGFARACNQGAEVASGRYLVFLNNDTVPQPGWLEEMIEVAETDDNVGIVGSKLLYPDGKIQHAGVAIADTPNPISPYHIYRKRFSDIPEANVKKEYQAVTGACLLIEKDIFTMVGGFDEGFRNGYEDVDLCFKVREKGFRIIYCPKSVLYHYESASKGRFDAMENNTRRLHEKWMGKIFPDVNIHGQGHDIKKTSIIILTLNQLEYTKRCIDSIFMHTRRPFELIIVDNGSTDGTLEYLESFVKGRRPPWFFIGQKGRETSLNDSPVGPLEQEEELKVTIIKNKKNLGFAAANNQGIKNARGDYILLMNNDVVVTPGWLDRLVACAEMSPDIGLVGPKTNYVSGIQLVDYVSYDQDTLIGLDEYASDLARKNAGQFKYKWRIVGFCMLIKREVIEKIGGLDTRYDLGNLDDSDFCLRANLAGFKCCIAEDCFVHHFGNRTFIGLGLDYEKILSENWNRYKKKWGIPYDLPYGESYDLSGILAGGFDPVKHYCPLDPEYYSLAYGEELFKKGDVEGARLVFERLLDTDEKNVDLLNNLGVIAFKEHDMEKARSYFERALEIDSHHPEANENMQALFAAYTQTTTRQYQVSNP